MWDCTHWLIGLICLFVGVFFGILTTCLCVASSRGEASRTATTPYKLQ